MASGCTRRSATASHRTSPPAATRPRRLLPSSASASPPATARNGVAGNSCRIPLQMPAPVARTSRMSGVASTATAASGARRARAATSIAPAPVAARRGSGVFTIQAKGKNQGTQRIDWIPSTQEACPWAACPRCSSRARHQATGPSGRQTIESVTAPPARRTSAPRPRRRSSPGAGPPRRAAGASASRRTTGSTTSPVPLAPSASPIATAASERGSALPVSSAHQDSHTAAKMAAVAPRSSVARPAWAVTSGSRV